MTRGEQIRNAVDATFPIYSSEKGRNYEQALMATGFEAGAKWADAHPKSPWISVKDKLPCNEKDLILEIIKGVQLRTKKVGVLSIDGDIDIAYMYNLLPYGWHWNTNDTITQWFPIQEPPKE